MSDLMSKYTSRHLFERCIRLYVLSVAIKVNDSQNDYFLCRNQNQYYFSTKTLKCKTLTYLNLSLW